MFFPAAQQARHLAGPRAQGADREQGEQQVGRHAHPVPAAPHQGARRRRGKEPHEGIISCGAKPNFGFIRYSNLIFILNVGPAGPTTPSHGDLMKSIQGGAQLKKVSELPDITRLNPNQSKYVFNP